MTSCNLIGATIIKQGEPDVPLPSSRLAYTVLGIISRYSGDQERESEKGSWMAHSTGIHRHPWFSLLLVTVLLLHPLCGENNDEKNT